MHGKERLLISHQAQTSVPHVGFISLCKCDWSFGPTLTPSHWKNTKMVNFSHVQKGQKGQNQVICGNNKQYFFFQAPLINQSLYQFWKCLHVFLYTHTEFW